MEIKEQFLRYISTERRLSTTTVTTYSQSLKLFDEFIAALPDPRTLETADSDNIRDWMEQLMEQGRSAAYVNRSLAALRTFYKFCFAQRMVAVDPAHGVVGPKKEKRLPRFFREGDMDKLLDSFDEAEPTGDDNSRLGDMRKRAIINVLYHTGLRASELISLDDSMVDMVANQLKVTGKRNKQRMVPFGEDLHNVLKEYVTLRDRVVDRQDDALLVDNKGKRVTYNTVRQIVKTEMSAVSSLDKCTPHVLRHSFATSMLNHDANLESIKKLLGHQSLNTTEIYTHTTFEQLKKIYNEAHPRR